MLILKHILANGIIIMSYNDELRIGKYLGVDYGDVRTGLAATDAMRVLASEIGFIKPNGMHNTAIAVAEKAKELGVVKIIVGLPKNMNGTEGERVGVVRAFIELLRSETDIEIDTVDERLTTVVAHTYLNMTNTTGKKRKNAVDSLSAAIMLQDYIDREKQKK